jgi:hypothetical protein
MTTAKAASATTGATASAAETTRSSASAAFGTGFGFIHGKSATVAIFAIQGFDSRIGFIIRAHFDKTEALAPAGHAILNDLCTDHRAMSGEELLERGIVHIITHVSDIQFLAHSLFPISGVWTPFFTFQVALKEADIPAQKVL